MNREVHVRIYERLKGKFLRPTHPNANYAGNRGNDVTLVVLKYRGTKMLLADGRVLKIQRIQGNLRFSIILSDRIMSFVSSL